MLNRNEAEKTTLPLGFGCGSVLGRVGRNASLKAMHSAWEMGIRFFDIAPSYGFGEAEGVLGEFLRGRRESALIASKYGIAPARPNQGRRALLPLARLLMKTPGMRHMRARSGPKPAARGQFTASGLRASVERSLHELQTDRIDVLFLHEATAEVMGRDELMAELDRMLRSGKLLRVGLYAEPEVAAEALKRRSSIITAMQFGGDLFDSDVASLMQSRVGDTMLVANHPFGSTRRITKLRLALEALLRDPDLPSDLQDKLRDKNWQIVLELVLGMLLKGTPIDLAVFSMMQPKHIQENVNAVVRNRFSVPELELIRQRIGSTMISAQPCDYPHGLC